LAVYLSSSTRNYVEDKVNYLIKKDPSYSFLQHLQQDYGESFGYFYSGLLSETYHSIGTENHRDSLARFNVISESKDNDFERSIVFLQGKGYEQKSAYILSNLGLLSRNIGLYTKAEGYYNRSLEIYDRIGDRVGLAGDYKNIGNVYYGMGDYPKALEHHSKALEIDEQLNNRVNLAKEYRNIGSAYHKMGDHAKALEYYNQALEIHKQLNDRVGLAGDNYNMSFPLLNMDKKEMALERLYASKKILVDFEKETGYSYPLLKDVERRKDFVYRVFVEGDIYW